ncbi:MAG: ribonuclease HIII [Lentisphaerae bacterium GWF2_45_14]|nr:MAG: ribonuclease HIII [Lentisphaerae bacterium GWF2_45_14]
MAPQKTTSYVCALNPEQSESLLEILISRSWTIAEAPHALWKASKDKTSIVSYKSGKLTVQGKETPDFVLYILEPEILKTASFGYDESGRPQKEEMEFVPHAGIDESGKGDFFGPLCIAAVYVENDKIRQELLKAGVKDSKQIKNDVKIQKTASAIRAIVKANYSSVMIGPEAYNRLYGGFGNLNKLLAWGHARALENLLEKAAGCKMAISDKFGAEHLIQRALKEKGKKIELIQKTKAESDIAVAAASILARDAFVRGMKKLGENLKMPLPLGAGPRVIESGISILNTHGEEKFREIAKLHFKTMRDVLASA